MTEDEKMFEIVERNFAKKNKAETMRSCSCGSDDCDCEVDNEPVLTRAGKLGFWAGDKTATWG